MRHGCVYSIELTDKWHRVNLQRKATRWLDLTRRERMKQMSADEMLRGFGVQQQVIQAMLPKLLCRGLCVASTVASTVAAPTRCTRWYE
jgi:hypothetical protein